MRSKKQSSKVVNTPSPKNVEWHRIGKELEYVATYASPERRGELLDFLKYQFQTLLHSTEEEIEEQHSEGNSTEGVYMDAGLDIAIHIIQSYRKV